MNVSDSKSAVFTVNVLPADLTSLTRSIIQGGPVLNVHSQLKNKLTFIMPFS